MIKFIIHITDRTNEASRDTIVRKKNLRNLKLKSTYSHYFPPLSLKELYVSDQNRPEKGGPKHIWQPHIDHFVGRGKRRNGGGKAEDGDGTEVPTVKGMDDQRTNCEEEIQQNNK